MVLDPTIAVLTTIRVHKGLIYLGSNHTHNGFPSTLNPEPPSSMSGMLHMYDPWFAV